MTTFHIITIFPEFFSSVLEVGLIKKAREKKIVDFVFIDLKSFGVGKHKVIDDRPYGGGAGMVLRPEPIISALRSVSFRGDKRISILMSPSGNLLTQEKLEELSYFSDIVIVCPRYEGVDERVKKFIDEDISIGDYVIHSGDVAALVIIEGVARLKEGFMTTPAKEELTFGILDFPQFTHPKIFEDMEVPEILLSGHHENIRRWRIEQSVKKTLERRPDLVLKFFIKKENELNLPPEKKEMIRSYLFDVSFCESKRDESLEKEIFHIMVNYLINIKELLSY
ncbi:MAG: tRNA (guanosine(37)-N1)-methyltransferase TrmD [Candidatus Calescibacterium sp.]